MYFSKRVNRATDPGDGIPSHKELTSQLDYEAELAVILKKDAKDVALEDVEDYIFGYTIMNDVSAREVQTAHRQWYFGKSLDGFTPLGPWIVTADSVEFPPKLRIQSRVNGELRQDSNTEQFIHGIAEVVSELSRGMTLKGGYDPSHRSFDCLYEPFLYPQSGRCGANGNASRRGNGL